MNPDPAHLSDPMFVLLAWAGGVALAGAVVTARGVVGPGFTWLVAGVAALIGLGPALATSGWSAGGATLATALAGLAVSRYRPAAAGLLAAGAGGFVTAATGMAGLPLALSATAALGGVTGEMLLGHWYLVDPRLPRWVLRALAIAGLAGVVADGLVLAAVTTLPDQALPVAVLWTLVATTALLMAGVLGALRYPAYSGVMAATGLSYLAVITGLAAVFFGRVVAAGGPGA